MLFGWAIGLIIAGLVIRLGLGAESLAWAAIFFIQPFSAVYYPVDTLPAAVRWIAWLLPSAPVFEGMRTVLVEHRFDGGLFGQAVAVLAVWLVVGGRGLHAAVPQRAAARAAAAEWGVGARRRLRFPRAAQPWTNKPRHTRTRVVSVARLQPTAPPRMNWTSSHRSPASSWRRM